MTPQSDRQAIADLLWQSMKSSPTFSQEHPNLANSWRTRIYPWLVNKQISAIWNHRNPEPFLTTTNLARGLSGDRFDRPSRRFEGLIGGELTEIEYQDLVSGTVKFPMIMLGGFPRSGTTSIQALIRSCWPSHIPERHSEIDRFSLWDYSKHDPDLMLRLSEFPSPQVLVIHTLRKFEDATASLAVGRGSLSSVDLELKVNRWKKWAALGVNKSIITIPFELIYSLPPRAMADQLEQLLGIPVEHSIPYDSTYEQLMRETGKGDIEGMHQSNVPSPFRSEKLAQAREGIRARNTSSDLMEMHSLYSQVLELSLSGWNVDSRTLSTSPQP
jgi:hypothetical protein